MWPITLILLALCGKLFAHDRAVYVSVTAFTAFAALFDLIKTLPATLRSAPFLQGAIGLAEKILPWYTLNLGWVAPAVIGLILGMVIRTIRKRGESSKA